MLKLFFQSSFNTLVSLIVSSGSAFSFLALGLGDLVGNENLSSAFGMSNLLIAGAAVAGPAITGI